jgi:hypothetical protein
MLLGKPQDTTAILSWESDSYKKRPSGRFFLLLGYFLIFNFEF